MLFINKNTTIKTITESKEAVVLIEAGATPDQIQNLAPEAKVAVLSNESPIKAIEALPKHVNRVDLNTDKHHLDAGYITLAQAMAIPTHVSFASGVHDLEILKVLLSKGMRIDTDSPKKQTLAELTRENQDQKTLIDLLQTEIKRLRSPAVAHEEDKSDDSQRNRLFNTVAAHRDAPTETVKRTVRFHLGPHTENSEIAQMLRKK